MTPRQGKKFRRHRTRSGIWRSRSDTRPGSTCLRGDAFRRGAGRGRTPARPLPERTRQRPGVGTGTAPGSTRGRCCIGRSGVDLTRIEGDQQDETTALNVLGEIGLDMSRWATVKHFTSWLGLCLHHKVSGGRVLSRRTRPTANLAAAALALAEASLHRSQSRSGAFFRRLKSRKGTPKAITATAHKQRAAHRHDAETRGRIGGAEPGVV